jgi:nucleotide-binding universal stress UspA family protein
MGLIFDSEAAATEVMAQWRDEAEEYLKEVAQRLRAAGMVVETRTVQGQPDRMICDVANYESIDLIVMSTHGRSGIDRWVYGSTANKVLRMANCPLLLVRATIKAGREISTGRLS